MDPRMGLSIRELLLNRGEVDPRAFPADQAVAEIEDVQEPRTHRPAAALEPEGPAICGGWQYRLCYGVVVPIPASDGLEAVDPKLREQGSVEALDLAPAMEWVPGAPD